MNILTTFLRLTEFTIPYGDEDYFDQYLPTGTQMDESGNYFIKIGESRTMFTSHLDVVCSKSEKVNHVIGSRFIKTDGSTILGADDKAGVMVMLNMIERKVPGLYYFFIGEEVGGVGSGNASFKGNWEDYDRCISFDRRGYTSVITEQFYGECCSPEFAIDLCSKLNQLNPLFKFKPDDTGSFTDSASFMDYIPECTNISVGYFKQHTKDEYQDIRFLDLLCEAVTKVDWENLPTKRDFNIPSSTLFKSQNVDLDSEFVEFTDDKVYKKENTINVFIDDFEYIVQLSTKRIQEEISMIEHYLYNVESVYFRKVWWDGNDAWIELQSINGEGGDMDYLGSRRDLIKYIKSLQEIPITDLNILGRVDENLIF